MIRGEVRTEVSVSIGKRRTGSRGIGLIILLAVAAVIGLGYGRPLTWAVLRHAPVLAERICGTDAQIDLVQRREIAPAATVVARPNLAEWFACRDAQGKITSAIDLHEWIVVSGGIATALLALLVFFALRPLGRLVFGARSGPGGRAPSRASVAWQALPQAWRWRISAAALATAVALAFSAALVPMTLQFGWLNHVPGAVRYFCPETGILHPRGYSRVEAFGQSRAATYSACSDAAGRVIEDDATHYRIIQTILLVWFLLFAVPFYFFWRWVLPNARWRNR